MRIALRFAYDGSAPNGYAQQPQGSTVEDAIIAALGAEGYVHRSWRTGSRTDKGVVAIENVAACTCDAAPGVVARLNQRLEGIWVRGWTEVPADWNPRHAASRTYEYWAPDQGESLPAMQEATATFLGRRDFSPFARLEEGRDPVRTVERFDVAAADGWRFTVSGPSFLWNQVRRMVAAVLRVGTGGLSIADLEAQWQGEIERADLAPAAGLLLRSVDYDPPLHWNEALDGRALVRLYQEAHSRVRLFESLAQRSS